MGGYQDDHPSQGGDRRVSECAGDSVNHHGLGESGDLKLASRDSPNPAEALFSHLQKQWFRGLNDTLTTFTKMHMTCQAHYVLIRQGRSCKFCVLHFPNV